jgi:hypothetical protein
MGGIAMYGKQVVLIAVLLILYFGLPILQQPARAEGPIGIISGTVFIDLNENGILDPGEPALGMVDIEITNGQSVINVTTDEFGMFTLPVGEGLWRAVINLPEGLEVLNDTTRQVTISSDVETEAVMDFAISPSALLSDNGLALLQSWVGFELEDALAALLPEQEQAPDEKAVEVATNEGDPDEAALQGAENPLDESGVILPVSGSGFSPRLMVMAVFAIMLTGGTVLALLGWRLVGAK